MGLEFFFLYHNVFGTTPRCSKHWGVILKCLHFSQEVKKLKLISRISLMWSGKVVGGKNMIVKKNS